MKSYIKKDIRSHLSDSQLAKPIGGMSVMHSHSTLPSMTQKYHLPIWKVPSCNWLESADKSTIAGNRATYEGTKEKYHTFAKDVLERLETLDV